MEQGTDNGTRDETLIARALEGDRSAFSALIRRYEDTVYRFAFKVCRNRDKAEETLQDTFVNVYRKLDTFDGKSKFSTWLYSIVTNNCLMKRRRTRMQDSLDSLDESPSGGADIPSWDETPVEKLLTQELRGQLDAAILKLPIEYRIVFVLRDIEGKTADETAQILGISVEATKSRLRRARAFLRDRLNAYMVTHQG
jgi:RNA polymerase sigma-70 factor (ECF subfamily)